MKLQFYDNLLIERESQQKVYRDMKLGLLDMVKSDNILAHQSTKDIFKTLIPELIANKDDEGRQESEHGEPKSTKRMKVGNS